MRGIYLFSSLLLAVLATTETDQIVLTGIDCEVTNTRPVDWEGTHYGPSQGRDGGYGTTYADGRLFEFTCGSCQDSQGHTGSYVTCGYSWMDVKDLEHTDNQLVITDVITESRGNAVDSCQTAGYQTAFTYASTTARDTDDVKSDKFLICYKLQKWSDVIFDRLDIVTAISARSAISVMQSQRTSKKCSQDWDTDYGLGQFYVTLDACKQYCVADSTCTGISWSDSHNDRCVKCHGPMQYAADHAWVTFDKEAGNAPELPSFPGDFMWSWMGPIPGANCVWLGDWMGNWQDNFLCTSGDKADPGFRYSAGGPIQGMKCINIHEPSGDHAWADNYLCYPNDLPYELTWSYTGRLPGQDCIQIYEAHEYVFHDYWRDNFICAPRTTVPDGASCNAEQLAKCTSFPCIDIRQGNEHHHIMTYTQQGEAKVTYYTNDFIAGGRTWTCTCAGCEEKSLVGTWTCKNDADDTIMYESAITISADYADNFLPNQVNQGYLGMFRHLDVCKPAVNLIGKFDTYNDLYANMCDGNPYTYCNSYADLKRDFCGGATCTESTTATCTFANSVYDCCKIHFENWGKAEIEAGTRAPPTCVDDCDANQHNACTSYPCIDLRQGTNHHHMMILDPSDTTKARITYFNQNWQAGPFWDCSRSAADDSLVGSWSCGNFYTTGAVSISADYADDFTDRTTEDSIDFCAPAARGSLCPAVSGFGGCSEFSLKSVNGHGHFEYPGIKDQAGCRQKCALDARCTSYVLHPIDGCALYKTLDGCTGNYGWTGYQMECEHAPKAYGDDTHPANFVSLFTHKAEPDVGPVVFPPKVIGLWKVKAYDRSDVMDTKQNFKVTAQWSTKKALTAAELASVSTLTSNTHKAEIAIETSAAYSAAVASGSVSMSALYGYEYKREIGATFQNQVSSFASQAFNQEVSIEKPINIPMKGPGDSETVNVWYFQTQVIAPGIAGSGKWGAVQHGMIGETIMTYGCGHHIPPNCLPGYCDPDDHNCWECTTKWATIDPDFRKPLQCAEAGEGGMYVELEESECPHWTEIRDNMPYCNESNACDEMCRADGPIRGFPGNSYEINNCYGAYDVFTWRCSELNLS